MTTINGDNIVTGTITGTTFLSVANVAGQYGYKTVRISDGEIVFGATTGPVTWIGETIFGKNLYGYEVQFGWASQILY